MTAINLSHFLSLDNDLLILSPVEAHLSRLTEIVVQSLTHIGVMGDAFPFLANLSIMENIALTQMYHQRLSYAQCVRRIGPAVETLGLGRVMGMRKESLSRRELLQAHLLRCLINHSSAILFPSPRSGDVPIILDCLRQLNRPARLWVSCLRADAGLYEDLGLKQVEILEA